MGFSRGRREPLPEVETTVWACTNEECNGWMRDTFSFDEVPSCPLCESKMNKEVRVLPKLD